MRNQNIQELDSGIDFIKIIKKLLKNWPYILLSFSAALVIGYLVNKSAKPEYENKIIMLISDNSSQRRRFTNETMRLQEMFQLSSVIEDELGILGSYPVIYETTKELNLNVSYYEKEGLINKDIYKNSPFTVLFDKDIPQPVNVYFEVSFISSDKFKLVCQSEDKVPLYDYANEKGAQSIGGISINKEFEFGNEIEYGGFKFKIILNGNYSSNELSNKTYLFKFNNLEQLTYAHQSSLYVERVSLESSLIDISFKSGNKGLVTDFLNKLAEVFLAKNLNKKNSIADKTIEFIDQQISEVADTLGITADQLRQFRTKHNVMDIDFLSQSVYEQMRELENQRAVLVVESKYYDYIKDYFENNQDLTDLLAPSAMGVDDPQLANMITQLTTVNAERSLILDNKSFSHPNLSNLNAQVNNLKNTILENIDYIVNTSNITINDINKRISELESQVKNLPAIEKELINIEREFHINDAIYTLLLETRAEAEIAKASNSPDYEIIEPGKYSSAAQVGPKTKMIYLASALLGLSIPIGLILLISAMDVKINDKRDIEKLTDTPILAFIGKNEKKSMLPIIETPKSRVAESFRSLRTSLQFYHKGEPKQKLMVTSSMSGDGKTFVALNLASAFSYYGKKTILIEFDLRNPNISQHLGLDNEKGLSSYLINDARLEDIILKTKIKNLDVITAGQIPPNPVELIASENTQNLIEILQSIYDYIVIDTPPIGVVTDPFLLIEYADVNIFTTRLNHTNKKLLDSVLRDLKQKDIKNIGIIVNDDEEITHSVYYDEEGRNLSYFRKKLNTIKSLVKLKKG